MPETVKGPYKLIESRQFASDAVFNPRPTSLVLVAGLEIVVQDSYGDYLLLTSPHYEEVEVPTGKRPPNGIEDAFWTVPYITRSVTGPAGGFRDITTTIGIVDKEVKAWEPEAQLELYAATFSFGVREIKPVAAFCELKQSWTQPHVNKLYHIMRYSLQLNGCAQRNLADAASRKGYSFLPIDDRYKAVTKKRKCKTHKHIETLYLSQPLASNLAAVLDNDEDRRGLRSRAAVLDKAHFSREYSGLLFCGDIAGYGAASAYAEAHMGSFTDDDHGTVLRDSATVAFTELFLEAGIAQVHTAGDGFICAIPLDAPSDARSTLKRFSTAYAAYLKRLDDLSARIRAHHEKNPQEADSGPCLLGSRLAVHYGKYRYGKMSQAASLLTSFDGREIVAVSRLEQGLRSIAKAPTLAQKYKIGDVDHIAAASREVAKLPIDNDVLPGVFKRLRLFEAASKEYSDKAWLLRAVAPGTGKKPGPPAKKAGAVRKTQRR